MQMLLRRSGLFIGYNVKRIAIDCVPCLFHTYYLKDRLLHNTDKVCSEHAHWLESYFRL